MNKIDWTKPIETIAGNPAKLIHILKNARCPYVVELTDPFGSQSVRCFRDGSLGCTYLRNVAPPLVLYGRPDIAEADWSRRRFPLDTHMLTLTPEDLARCMRPVSKGV